MPGLEYVQDYYPFDDDVMAAVEDATGQLQASSYEKLVSDFNIEDNLYTIHGLGAKPVEVLTLKPNDYDETEARVYHLPIGNGLSPNMIMRVLHLFAADPSKQLVIAGNPAGTGSNSGRVSLTDARQVAKTKSLTPFVDPLLKHVSASGVTSAEHLGYSYGADKAVTAVGRSAVFEIAAPRAVFAEPASVKQRTMIGLATAMGRTMDKYDTYTAESGIDSYIAVRQAEGSLNMVKAAVGLLRVSNIAMAAVLREDTFSDRLLAATEAQQTASTVAWGTASELADDDAMLAHMSYLRQRATAPVAAMRLEGMHHAGGDNLVLGTMTMLQGLKLSQQAAA